VNYTVRWLPAAEQELAALWLDTAARAAVTRAANALDQALQRAPEELGESRSQSLRILFEPPLGILFRVRVDMRVVEVAHVWEFG
jgi:hypothetical protein